MFSQQQRTAIDRAASALGVSEIQFIESAQQLSVDPVRRAEAILLEPDRDAAQRALQDSPQPRAASVTAKATSATARAPTVDKEKAERWASKFADGFSAAEQRGDAEAMIDMIDGAREHLGHSLSALWVITHMLSRVHKVRREVLAKRVDDLERQVELLKFQKGLTWRGIWEAGLTYFPGETCTRGGLWICRQQTSDRPGESPHWQLMLKREGKDRER
jgi:hypothetical protein